MTTAMRAVRASEGEQRSALRIAVARAGRIEREWVIEDGAVTFGRSHEADVFLTDHATRSATLLRVDDGAMTLSIPAGASGRLQLATGPCDLAALAGTSVALDPSARGRIVLAGQGESAVAVLFQRVAAPEKRARPELPASVRGGILSRVDWLFTGLAAASFMLHFAFVVGMSEADWPLPPSLAVLDERAAEVLYSTPPMPDVPEITDATTPTSPTTPSSPSEPTSTHASPVHRASTTSASHGDPTIDATQQINVAVQTLIGANGIDGAIANLLNGAQPTQSSAEILAAASAVDVASRQTPEMRTGHTTDLPDGDFGPRRTTISTLDRPGELVETAPHPTHITVESIVDPIDPGVGFDDAMLRRALRARMPQIQACYEHQLTRTPGLAGRITMSMQVERAGILSHIEATDDTVGSRELTECVIRSITTIRVPTGPSEPLTVGYPIVFAPQN